MTGDHPDRTLSLEGAGAAHGTGPVRVRVAGLSDIGLVRRNNEDALQVRFLDGSEPAPDAGGEGDGAGRGVLLVVSDGMGGVEAGEVASGIVVDVVGRVMDEEWARRGERTEFAELRNDLRTAVARANRAVLDDAVEHPARTGMGATLTAGVILRDHLLLAHVGDSRCYLLRDGTLKCLTSDQSLAEELVRRGIVQRGSPAYDARRSVLIRVVGQAGRLEPDAETASLAAGDRLLLCTDGLHGPVDDEAIAGLLGAAETPGEAVRDLVDAARARGAPDNVSCVVAFVDGPGLPAPSHLDDGGGTVSVAIDADALEAEARDTTQTFHGPLPDVTGEYSAEQVLADPQLRGALLAAHGDAATEGASAPTPPGTAPREAPPPPVAPHPWSTPVAASPPIHHAAAGYGVAAKEGESPFLDPGPPPPGAEPGHTFWAGLWILLAVLVLGRMMLR